MSADVLEFLKKKFMDELQEAEEGIPLHSYFEEIKHVLQGKRITVSTPVSMKDCLYNLSIALEDCILFLEKRKMHSRKPSSQGGGGRYSLPELWFLYKTKRKLTRINKKLCDTHDVVSTSSAVDIRAEGDIRAVHIREGYFKEKAWVEIADWSRIYLEEGLTKEIAMVGIGGSGKTFTARVISEKLFTQNKIWIDLSKKMKGEIEFVEILKAMLKQCGGDIAVSQGHLNEEEALLEAIHNVLDGRRYIMVFDGIWDIKVDWYMRLREKLEWHKRGSWEWTNLIITTTRLASVAKVMVGSKNLYHLPPPFSHSEIWRMCLGTDSGVRLPLEHPTLVKMGNEIINKSEGLPLAAMTLYEIMCRHVFGQSDLESATDITFVFLIWINPKDDPEQGNNLHLSLYSIFNFGEVVFDISHMALTEINLDYSVLGTDLPLKIIIYGGDATINWVLQSVNDIRNLPIQRTSFVTMPLGNEVNTSLSLGWGDRLTETNSKPENFLKKIKQVDEILIDSWNIAMRMLLPNDDLQIPKTLQLKSVAQDNLFHMGGDKEVRARFWNYFIIGLDAQDWFGASKFKSWPKKIILPVNVKIKDKQQKWKKLDLHPSTRSIVCLNMPSFPGGLDPWGQPNLKKKREKNFTASFVNDGILEIIGFRDAWFGEKFLPLNVHSTRLAQTNQICFGICKGEAKQICLSFDGTRWKQPTPTDDDTYLIEVSYSSQTKFVPTTKSKCKLKDRNLQLDESSQQGLDLYKELPSNPLSR